MTSEATTRKNFIDAQLRLAGWNLGDPTQVIEEFEIDLVKLGVVPLRAAEPGHDAHHYGKQYVDYVLLLQGRVVAVVEAKRTSVDPRLGQEQALQYAQHIQRAQGGPVPFVLYSNGHDIWMWESDLYPPTSPGPRRSRRRSTSSLPTTRR